MHQQQSGGWKGLRMGITFFFSSQDPCKGVLAQTDPPLTSVGLGTEQIEACTHGSGWRPLKAKPLQGSQPGFIACPWGHKGELEAGGLPTAWASLLPGSPGGWS